MVFAKLIAQRNPASSFRVDEFSMQHGIFKSSKNKEEMTLVQIGLFAANIFSVSLALMITFAILGYSQDSVLPELTLRWLFILALWETSFSTLSSFTSFVVTTSNAHIQSHMQTDLCLYPPLLSRSRPTSTSTSTSTSNLRQDPPLPSIEYGPESDLGSL